MVTIRVRFAPSPTGFLHVGGLRTALYNYLFARKNHGVLILRIEDTDRNRFVEGAVKDLIETLHWAGIDYDEGPEKGGASGPYVQSERLSIYREHARQLLESGSAYYAFDTPEELQEMRKAQEEAGGARTSGQMKYDRRALRLTSEEVRKKLAAGIPSVIRMKVPDGENVGFDDLVRGHVEFASETLDDQVLLKSDGYPTYHLANVVDDHLMGVTHVIRGEEWLSSTPKHVLLYRAFGWELPAFAHLPLLLNPDKTKLSKRQGDVAVEEYRQKGYLPGALVNFVALLGWNPGRDQEIFSLQELISEFSIERVGRSGAVFDLDKLHWMNTRYFRGQSDAQIASEVRPLLSDAGLTEIPDSYLYPVIALMKERIERPEDLLRVAPYFFRDPEGYDEQARKKNWRPETGALLRELAGGLQSLARFDRESIERVVRAEAERAGVGASRLIHPLRLAITGLPAGPGVFELMALLGKETCLRRITRALESLG